MEASYSSTESLSIYLPLPYRVLFIFILGIWLFALNLHYFSIVRIDVSPMIRYTRGPSEPSLHRSVYELAGILSGLFSANLICFWIVTGGDAKAVEKWEVLPLTMLGGVLVVFLWPFGEWNQRGRWRFIRMLRRILMGGLSPDLRFADVLLADALTSYAKVLGDLAALICMFLTGYSSTNVFPDRSFARSYLIPFIMSIPYLIRLRQCFIEYVRARRKGLPSKERVIHLFNAAKYASAFPVIICSALQRGYNTREEHIFSQAALSRLWLLAVIFNSLFSFYWDVTRDWDLTFFSTRRKSDHYPYGLRENRHFVTKEFYYSAVIIDLLLRGTWSFKLSPHLDHIDKMEGGIFVLELLEVFRRWVWVFFRVEKEWVASRAGGGLGLLEDSGMLLGEYGKAED